MKSLCITPILECNSIQYRSYISIFYKEDTQGGNRGAYCKSQVLIQYGCIEEQFDFIESIDNQQIKFLIKDIHV